MGGAERVISILANHFRDKGMTVEIVLLLNNSVKHELRENIKIIDLHGKYESYRKNVLFWYKNIRKHLKSSKPDRVVSFVGRINALVLLASLGLKKTIIVSERNDPKNDGRSRVMLEICNVLYKKASMVVFQTKYQRNCFSNALKYRSCIIPNPVFVNLSPMKRENNRIVTVGRLYRAKNHSLLIEAAYILNDKFPDLKYEIYGDGDFKKELIKKITNLGLNNTVKLMVNKADVHSCIAKATIFVLTSRYEGASNALIEAMMLGLPCICTAYPGADEIINDGYNGILVPQDDPIVLAEKIEYLLSDRKLCEYLSHNAIESSQRFRSDRALLEWEKTIIDI